MSDNIIANTIISTDNNNNVNNSKRVKLEVEKKHCPLSDCKLCDIEAFINSEWRELLKDQFNKEYFKNIKAFLHNVNEFYPPIDSIFNFTNFTAFENIKVVIIGQDPYHNKGQAMGLSFSVPKNCKLPPSLNNIYKEVQENIPNFKIPNHGDLTNWAKQGVLLLNDTLTVTKNMPSYHSKIGWKIFTTAILKLINDKLDNIVFVLWGNHAREKKSLIDAKKHLILESGHPSPFSVKLFEGCQHFSKINEYLKQNSKEQINWDL